jgi:Fe-S cluster assembly protein SufB
MSITVQNHYKYGFRDDLKPVHTVMPGLSRKVVEEISALKNEPDWMRERRLHALEIFQSKPVPTWGADLSRLDFDQLRYYIRPTDRKGRSWDEVPAKIKRTFDRIGVPQAERDFLAGVEAQYDSEVIYGNLKKEWEDQGIIFCDTDTAVQKYPDIVKQYFGTVVPAGDNKFASLNTAVWSGGSFVYVPAGKSVTVPLQAYFRINQDRFGQFERTLIIAEEGATVHYVEGCTAPIYRTDSLHAAVVEVIVKHGARARYTTIQNWSNNIYNLVTKRAFVYEDAVMEWIDFNSGSKVTMKYPSCFLWGRGAKGDVLSLALAGGGQHQDAGAKAMHLAPYTSSTITSKSVSHSGGKTTYRGQLKIIPGAKGSKSNVRCDALILDGQSSSETIPVMNIFEQDVTIGHEASVGRVSEDQLFYLMSRGINGDQALSMIVNGFIEPITKELPLEYAVELNRLIRLEMEGSVG